MTPDLNPFVQPDTAEAGSRNPIRASLTLWDRSSMKVDSTSNLLVLVLYMLSLMPFLISSSRQPPPPAHSRTRPCLGVRKDLARGLDQLDEFSGLRRRSHAVFFE